MTKIILFLFKLLKVSEQQSLTRHLVGTVFPGSHIHGNPSKRGENERADI